MERKKSMQENLFICKKAKNISITKVENILRIIAGNFTEKIKDIHVVQISDKKRFKNSIIFGETVAGKNIYFEIMLLTPR